MRNGEREETLRTLLVGIDRCQEERVGFETTKRNFLNSNKSCSDHLGHPLTETRHDVVQFFSVPLPGVPLVAEQHLQQYSLHLVAFGRRSS